MLALIAVGFLTCRSAVQHSREDQPFVQQREVSTSEAQLALDAALAKQCSDYEWGGNGPEVFDCSGLIVWAYHQAFGRSDLFYDGYAMPDASMQTLYDYNVRLISAEKVSPGDLIFITYDEGFISHGGLVVAVNGTSVQFINASSSYDKVVVDEWELKDTVRGQWIEAFGRLKVCVE